MHSGSFPRRLYAENEVLFNWAPTTFQALGSHSCWLHQHFWPPALSGPSPALWTCSQAFRFLDQGASQPHGKASRLWAWPARQRPNLRSQETLTTTIRAAAVMWKRRMWTRRVEFEVPVCVFSNNWNLSGRWQLVLFPFTKSVSPGAAHLGVCVWGKAACLEISYPLC